MSASRFCSRRAGPAGALLWVLGSCQTLASAPDGPVSLPPDQGAVVGAPFIDAAGLPDSAADLALPPCLPQRDADLAALVMAQPFATRSGAAKMTPVPLGAPASVAAHDAALAWAAGDCPAFLQKAGQMGYAAQDVRDTATGRRHWVLTDTQGRYNGVFVFRAPDGRARSRPLVVDAPHLGFDFNDDRAVRVYRELDAVAFLQNSAHRCNLDTASGCSAVTSYPCPPERASDAVHAVDHLYYAVYDGLEEARDDLHFEYHGASSGSLLPGCAGTAHISQASSIKLSAAVDDGTYPSRFWQALLVRLPGCVCYHQRQTGCQLNGAASTAGRRTNQEASGSHLNTCTAGATALAGRFLHFEWYNVSPGDVIASLAEAIPLP